MNRHRRICLVGVRGIGKTTLIRSLLPQLPEVEHIVGSAVLRELVGPEFDHFDGLPEPVKERYRRAAIAWMERHQDEQRKAILCDGHTSLMDERTRSVVPVFTDRDGAFFRELILLDGPPELVVTRRTADPTKWRATEVGLIAAELEGERSISEAVAQRWGMVLHRLQADEPTVGIRLLELLT